MKKGGLIMKTAMSTLFLVLAVISPAFAANSATADQNGIFVSVFVGVCALIVVAQLVPALVLILGYIKASVMYAQNKETSVNNSSPNGK